MSRGSGVEIKIERRRELVKDIWIKRGVTNQKQIAQILADEQQIEITQQTISNDLKVIRKQTLDQRKEEVQAFVIEGYLLTWNESLQAWELSKQNKEIQVQESIEHSKGVTEDGVNNNERAKVQFRTEGQSGNPSHIRNAQESLKALREMFGLDAPDRLEHSGQIALVDLLQDLREDDHGQMADDPAEE